MVCFIDMNVLNPYINIISLINIHKFANIYIYIYIYYTIIYIYLVLKMFQQYI